jgi:hypothetical protein
VIDIILAELGGTAWLVRGERYIDDLLFNSLPRDISIEIIACESKSAVDGLWLQEEGWPDEGRLPWMIHPGIVRRIRGAQSGHSIFFGQWSALLDSDAQAVIRAASVSAEESAGVEVFLISYRHADEAKAMTDLTSLRYTLIEAELTGLGVAHARIVRESRDAANDPRSEVGKDRFDIRVGADNAP